jgi:pimeloyl-ACP methyl ester carboxylesterase
MFTVGAPNSTTQAPGSAGAEERFLTVDGVRVRYLFRPCSKPAPQSPPILLIHGLLGFSYSWRHNIDPLSEIADIYAPDLPGVGYSERSSRLDCSFRGIAEFLFHFADTLKLHRINLIATSHGGGVAIAAVARDLEEHGFENRRVQRLVLVAPVNPWSAGRAWLTDALATPVGWWCARACYPLLARCQGLFLRRVYGDPSRIERDAPGHYALPALIPGTASHLQKVLKSWPSDISALRKSLATIREVPTLLIWGTCDTAVRPSSAEPLALCFRHAQIKMIECAGHLPYEETPEEFNAAVMPFLASSF